MGFFAPLAATYVVSAIIFMVLAIGFVVLMQMQVRVLSAYLYRHKTAHRVDIILLMGKNKTDSGIT
jgi:hypothetical protein